jgi:hypothetical protein
MRVMGAAGLPRSLTSAADRPSDCLPAAYKGRKRSTLHKSSASIPPAHIRTFRMCCRIILRLTDRDRSTLVAVSPADAAFSHGSVARRKILSLWSARAVCEHGLVRAGVRSNVQTRCPCFGPVNESPRRSPVPLREGDVTARRCPSHCDAVRRVRRSDTPRRSLHALGLHALSYRVGDEAAARVLSS